MPLDSSAVSYGFPGSYVDPLQWAVAERFTGADLCVGGPGDWAVTAVSSGADRTVTVAPGSGWAAGILTVTSVTESRQAAAVSGSTGTVRWDTLVARHVWGSTNAVDFVILQGVQTQLVASGLMQQPGAQYDMPLALVQFTAGTSYPTAVIDLRAWASKLYYANDLRGVPKSSPGQTVQVGSVTYRLQPVAGSGGLIDWVPVDKPGYVYDSTYGWLPLVVGGTYVANLSAASGSLNVFFSQGAMAGHERYAFTVVNGNSVSQPNLLVRGVKPAFGTQAGITITYDSGLVAAARFNYLGTYIYT